MIAKQSTALTVVVGPILDSTGAEYASAVIGDLSISKNGGTLTAMASAATLTYIANGMYTLVTTTGNMDTLGAVQVTCNKATYQMPKMERNVVPASVYDAIITNATNATGGLPTATAAISAFAGAISTLTAGNVRTELATELGRIDQTIGSRATQTSVDAVASYIDTEVAAIKAKTDNLPSDPADASDIATSFGTVNSTLSTIASYVDTEVAAIKAKTDLIAAFPANFNLLSITSGGAIASVINVLNVDELGAGALIANGAVDSIPPAVWNALTTATYTDQSFGDRLLISTNNTREVAVTGSHHVAAVLHDAEPNSIPEDAFVTGALSARALAADAATEIATAVGTLQVLVDMGVMIINDGTANARFSVSALQNAPAGEGGGGQTINVYPVSASTPERVAGTTITYYRNEIRTVSVVTDFTLTSLTLVFVIEDSEGADLLTIPDGSISRSDKTFTVSIGTAVTATISNYRWALRDITGGSNSVIARGVFSVQEAAASA